MTAASAGYLQSKISERIDTRYTPRLRFELDLGVKKSLAISQLLHDLLPPDDVQAAATEDADADETAAATDET
jgi:ribosome-binding factor A